MAIIQFPNPRPGRSFSPQEKADLYALIGRRTVRGTIGGIEFDRTDEGEEFASLEPTDDAPALYGLGLDHGRYRLIDRDGNPVAEGNSLGDVLQAIAS